ncbi:unnamed protein product [Cochlearia groenlandica]
MEASSKPFMSNSYLESQETSTKATKNYLTSLHSTQKQPSKLMKRPIRPSSLKPIMHPHVYRVEPINFKELVQRLTGAPDQEEDVAKPVKTLNDSENKSSTSFMFGPSSSWGDLSLQNYANLNRT